MVEILFSVYCNSGYNNTAVGLNSLYGVTNQIDMVAVGYQAGNAGGGTKVSLYRRRCWI